MPRRTVYYRSVKAAPKVQDHLLKPIKPLSKRLRALFC